MTERILVTSALPYVNGVKHLGNLVGSLLPADVHARHARQRGRDVLFVCATDEHGTPAELAAAAAGEDVRTFCDRNHELQADTYRRFGLSFDHFGRSSAASNHELTRHFFRRLKENGFVEEREISQLWSSVDGRFLPDRYVEGTCPRCGHDPARGDQCDGCGATLDPTDLVGPRSAISGDPDLELRRTRHLFLRQSALVPGLRRWVDEKKDGWPRLVAALAEAAIEGGIRDRCITRDLSWGVAVPEPGFEDKVFYVWFDAPIAYLAATKDWADADLDNRDWRSWWRDGDVRIVQFLAKDNIPFHVVGFPATLEGSGEPWRKADLVAGVSWLTYERGKFSTSTRRGVFLDEALELLPADPWRWWLAANSPETDDVDFSFRRFAEGVNSDLADKFGNFVARILRFVGSAWNGEVPQDGTPGPAEEALAADVAERIARLDGHHHAASLRRVCAEIRGIWDVANAYAAKEAPWSLRKTYPERAAVVARTCVDLVRVCAAVAWPVIPTTAEKALAGLGLEGRPVASPPSADHGVRSVRDPGILFAKLDAGWVDQCTERFSGN